MTGAHHRRSQDQEAQASLADFCAIARSQLAKLVSLTTLDASSSIIRTPSFGSGRRLQPFSRRKVKQATKAVRLSALMAAELGVAPAAMQKALEKHVRAHLDELAEVRPDFR